MMITTDVEGCPRCGGEHIQIGFNELKNGSSYYSHFAICPTENQPILLFIETEKDAQHEETD